MYKFIAMHCGYVESRQVSLLIYSINGHPGFNNMAEAITELALDMYSKYYEEYLSIYNRRYDLGKCCTDSLIKDNNSKFCSSCGSVIKNYLFDEEEFVRTIKELHGADSDSYGESERANNRELIWNPFWNKHFLGAPKDSIIYIGENAEYILLEALAEAKPELNIEFTNSSPEWKSFKQNRQPCYGV